MKLSEKKVNRPTRQTQKRKLYFKFPAKQQNSVLSKSKRLKLDVKAQPSTSHCSNRTKRSTTSFLPPPCSPGSDDFVHIPQRLPVEKPLNKGVQGISNALSLNSGADNRESTDTGVLMQNVHNGLPVSVDHSKTVAFHGAAPLQNMQAEVELAHLVTGTWISASEGSVGMENCGRSIQAQRSMTDYSSFSNSTPLLSTVSDAPEPATSVCGQVASSTAPKKDATISSCNISTDAVAESHSSSTVAIPPEKQQVRRGRGRPPGSKNKPKNYPLAFEKAGRARTVTRTRREPQRTVRKPDRQRSSYATAENRSQIVATEKSKNLAAESRLSEDPLTSGMYSVWIPPACARVLMENVKITDVTTDAVTITFKESATEAGFFSK